MEKAGHFPIHFNREDLRPPAALCTIKRLPVGARCGATKMNRTVRFIFVNFEKFHPIF